MKDDWVYCGDGNNLPKVEGFYLISLSERLEIPDDIAVVRCWYNAISKRFSDYPAKFIDAWQPLPERYKGNG